jgi:hypothetical protein
VFYPPRYIFLQNDTFHFRRRSWRSTGAVNRTRDFRGVPAPGSQKASSLHRNGCLAAAPSDGLESGAL